MNHPSPLSDSDIQQLLANAVAVESDIDDELLESTLNSATGEPLTDSEVTRILDKARGEVGTVAPRDAVVGGRRSGNIALGTSESPATPSSMRYRRGRDSVGQSNPSRRGIVAMMMATAIALVLMVSLFVPMRSTSNGLLIANNSSVVPFDDQINGSDEVNLASPSNLGVDNGLVARQRPEVEIAAIQVGDIIETSAREKRMLELPDGSILFVNEGSKVEVLESRRLKLHQGEIFVDVAQVASTSASEPTSDDLVKFQVGTLQRDVTALGTKFAVRTSGRGGDVSVTQGKVKVDGVHEVVGAGQQLALLPGDEAGPQPSATPMPRASRHLSWTRDLMAAAETPLIPPSGYRGGKLIAVDPNGQEVHLTMRKYHVDVHIEDGFARTTIDQTYFNNTWSRMEGTFHFPLPPDASLSRLAMYVNGKLMEGGMAEREHARNVFERIRHTRRDPALLEWVDGSTFKMRVFPLEPRQEKRIVLSYTQRLPHAYGEYDYRFPTGHTMDFVKQWSTSIRIAGGAKRKWRSSSHDFSSRRDGDDLVLSATQKNATLESDIVLSVPTAGDLPKKATERKTHAKFSKATHEGHDYMMIRFRPYLAGEKSRKRRHLVILFEATGKQDPLLARTQIDVLKSLLDNAEHNDTFSIVVAANDAKLFDEKPQPCVKKQINRAVKFLEKQHLVGALDLQKALKACEEPCRIEDSLLVHLGTGIPVLGERDQKKLLKALPEGTPYIGVGVGKRWSRQFMKQAASRTGGYFTQINPDEKVAWRSFELLSTLNAPRLLDVRVMTSDEDQSIQFLNFADTIVQGEEFAAVARLRDDAKLPSELLVTGQLNGKTVEFRVPVKKVEGDASYLPRTWAKLEIDRLIADGAESHKQEIIELSKAMYVISPYTSLLVLEDEKMYEQFHVDRGRKDHWALYPCPKQIKVVKELGAAPASVADNKQTKDEIRQRLIQDLLRTFVIRQQGTIFANPTAYSNIANPNDWTSLRRTRMKWTKIWGRPVDESSFDADDGFFYSPPPLREWTLRGNYGTKSGRIIGLPVRDFMPEVWTRDGYIGPETVVMESFMGQTDLNNVGIWLDDVAVQNIRGAFAKRPRFRWGYLSDPMVTFSVDRRSGLDSQQIAKWQTFDVDMNGVLDFAIPDTSGVNTWAIEGTGLVPMRPSVRFDGELSLLIRQTQNVEFDLPGSELHYLSVHNGEANHLLGLPHYMNPDYPYLPYRVPRLSTEDRILEDLVMRAPGLNTSHLDLLAVIDQELPKDEPTGTVDERARELIEKARSLGWESVVFGSGPRRLRVRYNGAGQFVFSRVVSEGLREQVVCDGENLWHLYEELGVGSKRSMNRIQRRFLLSMVPWLLPPVEDLAVNFHIESAGKRRLLLKPIKANGQGHFIELRFAKSGSLAEMRVVDAKSQQQIARQTFSANGVVTIYDAQDEVVSSTKLNRRTVKPANVKPSLQDLVVLPMPVRTQSQFANILTRVKGNYQKLTEDEALQVIAHDLSAGNGTRAMQIIGRKFRAHGDRRIGFLELLASSRVRWNPTRPVNCGGGFLIKFNAVEDHPDSELAKFINYRAPQAHIDDNQFDEEMTGSDGFVRRMSQLEKLIRRFRSGKDQRGNAAWVKGHRRLALQWIRTAQTPWLAWELLQSMRAGESDEAAIRDFITATKELESKPVLSYLAKYERARMLIEVGSDRQARLLFNDLYNKAIANGQLPHLEQSFVASIRSMPEGEDLWKRLLTDAVRSLLKQQNYFLAKSYLMQSFHLGAGELAKELTKDVYVPAVKKSLKSEDLKTAAALCSELELFDEADECISELLQQDEYKTKVELWRMAATIADRRGKKLLVLERLERALDLEYAKLPDVIEIASIRQSYGDLLQRFQEIAKAYRAIAKDVPADFVSRVIRTVGRWRYLDDDDSPACHAAGNVFLALGKDATAWKYYTTPIAQHPNQAGPWHALANSMQQAGRYESAYDAYSEAFRVEPTNAQTLWNHASLLESREKPVRANALFKQIAEGDWQPRFANLKRQAQKKLGM
ncbi:MAG: hypothetical protein CMJ78_08740 [Planctomycetaceae bacterium]|nr:hypothetical protein [Planctomycetaceae bacterium]